MPDRPQPDWQQGVFETLLIVDGRPIELDAHLDRLAGSLEALFGDHPLPSLGEEIEARARGVALGSVRVAVAPASSGGLATTITVADVDRELAFPRSQQTVAVHSLVLVGGLGAHKWVDRSLLDEAQSQLPPGALPIVLDQDGTVLEASRANAFAVKDGVLVTPPADGRILPGITRARVIELAAGAGLATLEAELSRNDLLGADEVFLTGSVRGVERVRAFDGSELPAQDEIGSRIAAKLRQTWVGAQVG